MTLQGLQLKVSAVLQLLLALCLPDLVVAGGKPLGGTADWLFYHHACQCSSVGVQDSSPANWQASIPVWRLGICPNPPPPSDTFCCFSRWGLLIFSPASRRATNFA